MLEQLLCIMFAVILCAFNVPCIAETSVLVQINEIINLALTAYFVIEMLIKLCGLGFVGYVSDRMNTFDGLIVMASIVEVAISFGSDSDSNAALSVFRSFRLMRVFKLARRWAELNKIVRTIFRSLSSIGYLSLLLLVFIFIMALLGMQVFGFRCVVLRSLSQVCPCQAIRARHGHALSA